jgi:hypothetical protein
MKRILLLICALIILADLADDGCLGKARPLAPRCLAKISLTLSPGSSDSFECPAGIVPTKFPGVRQPWQNQIILIEVDEIPAIIDHSLLSSSGGLPL